MRDSELQNLSHGENLGACCFDRPAIYPWCTFPISLAMTSPGSDTHMGICLRRRRGCKISVGGRVGGVGVVLALDLPFFLHRHNFWLNLSPHKITREQNRFRDKSAQMMTKSTSKTHKLDIFSGEISDCKFLSCIEI